MAATGCLEATVSDRAVVQRAVSEGILTTGDDTIGSLYRLARDGSEAAHGLLVERATVLGKAVTVLRAFTGDDHGVGFAELGRRTGLPKATLQFPARCRRPATPAGPR